MRKVSGLFTRTPPNGFVFILLSFLSFSFASSVFCSSASVVGMGSPFFGSANEFRGIAGFLLLDPFLFLELLWDSNEPLR